MHRKKVLHAMSGGGAPVADAEWFRAIKLTWVLEGSGVCRAGRSHENCNLAEGMPEKEQRPTVST